MVTLIAKVAFFAIETMQGNIAAPSQTPYRPPAAADLRAGGVHGQSVRSVLFGGGRLARAGGASVMNSTPAIPSVASASIAY